MEPMKTLRRAPVVSDAAEQIRSAILDGSLVPGSRIAQDEIAAQLGVSRLPIRQALLVLEGEGLVLLDHNRGAMVAPLDVKFISDLFDFRAVVDSQVAGMLAARRDFDARWLTALVRRGTEGRAPRRTSPGPFDAISDRVCTRPSETRSGDAHGAAPVACPSSREVAGDREVARTAR